MRGLQELAHGKDGAPGAGMARAFYRIGYMTARASVLSAWGRALFPLSLEEVEEEARRGLDRLFRDRAPTPETVAGCRFFVDAARYLYGATSEKPTPIYSIDEKSLTGILEGIFDVMSPQPEPIGKKTRPKKQATKRATSDKDKRQRTVKNGKET